MENYSGLLIFLVILTQLIDNGLAIFTKAEALWNPKDEEPKVNKDETEDDNDDQVLIDDQDGMTK